MKSSIKFFLSLIFVFGFYSQCLAAFNPPQPQVYNFCSTPNYNTVTHNTWYFDIVNGNDSTGNGSQATPWKSLQAVFSAVAGVGPRLKSLNAAGVILPGDVILLENGNYGSIVVGVANVAGSQTGFLTISADSGATSVSFNNLTINPFSKLYFNGMSISSNGTGNNATDALVLFNNGSFPIQDVIFNNMSVNSQADVSAWSQSRWFTNANNGYSVNVNGATSNISCVAIQNNNVYNVLAGFQLFASNFLLYNNNIFMTGQFAADIGGNNGLVTRNIFHDGNNIGGNITVPGKTLSSSNIEVFDNIIWKHSSLTSTSFLASFYDGIVNMDSDMTNINIHNNLVITDAEYGIGGQSFHNSKIINNTILQDGTVSSNGNPSLWVGQTATGSSSPSNNVTVANNFVPALGNASFPFYNIGTGVGASNNLLPYNTGGIVITDYNSSSAVQNLLGNSGSATNYTQAFSSGVNTVDKSGGYNNQIKSYDPIHFTFNLRPLPGSLLKTMNVGTLGFGNISPSILPTPNCLPGQSCQTYTPSSVSYPFTALHTYFIAPASGGGSDSNNGLTLGSPWLTPNHVGLVCGDVINAAAGAYNSANFDSYSHGSSLWGTVGSCPSTSAGIDGKGGIYMVPIVCATAFACTINASTQYGMNIDKSNWAVEGFTATATASGFGSCFVAAPLLGGSSIAYDAFINDIASGCGLAGFQASNNTTTFSISTDQFGVVGSIAFNGSQSAQECGSGISDNTPVNVNSQAGTHVYIAGNFSYGNIDGPCGPNSSAGGGYPTASASFSAGASSITVNAVSGWGANWPITDLSPTGSYPSTSIPTHTFTGTIAGLTVPLTNNVAAPGVVSGDQLVVGTSTDGEGVILDSWALNPYTGQAAVENNIFWGNGGRGFEAFCLGTCASALKIFAQNNTIYGDSQDYKIDGAVGEVTESFSGGTLSIINNLVQASVVKAPNSLTQPPWNGTTGVSTHGTGQPVNAASFGDTGMTITGNWFKSAPSATCPTANTPSCDGGNNIVDYNGVNYQTGNTLGTDPLFSSVGSLPATSPNCSGQPTTVACMASVIAALTPSASGTSGKGYQAPGPCVADALYPVWMKGIIYLKWNGTSIIENQGLVTKPCGM